MTDEELDSFIEDGEFWEREIAPYYISDFCAEALIVGRELKKLRQEVADARTDR